MDIDEFKKRLPECWMLDAELEEMVINPHGVQKLFDDLTKPKLLKMADAPRDGTKILLLVRKEYGDGKDDGWDVRWRWPQNYYWLNMSGNYMTDEHFKGWLPLQAVEEDKEAK